MNRYDLHMHTNLSPDSTIKPEKIVEIAKMAGLNGIAITDHHTIKAALLAKKLNKDRSFEVVVGQEIATDHGDVIALYIRKEIRERNMWKVFDKIKKQGGLVVIPHPFRIWSRFKCRLEDLEGKIDAVETFNSRYLFSNKMTEKLAKRLSASQIGSSDGHIPIDIGKGYTLFEGDLRSAIRKRKTVAGGTTKFGLVSQIASTVRNTMTLLGL